jgi:hypothetical protein
MLNGRLPIPSNVTRLSRAIKAVSQDGIPQIVNYQLGVGSQGSLVDRVVGGKWTSAQPRASSPARERTEWKYAVSVHTSMF